MIDQNPERTFQVAGLNVTKESLEELQESLDRITEAEQKAWRESRDIIIGHTALRTENQGENNG